MPTIAERLLLPTDLSVLRAAFLYVGQGEATLLVIPDVDGTRRFVLVDINRDVRCGGIDVVRLLEDLLPKTIGRPYLDVFINTHPHNDHLCGLDSLVDRIDVGQVWHTGFTPSDRHADAFAGLQKLIKKVTEGGGLVREYRGTRSEESLGRSSFNVLSPAEHTKEEIDTLEGQERDCRIHDYCGVFRFGYGGSPKHIMLTGDADKTAWANCILGASDYHAERLPCAVLSASHHGSRSFFKETEEGPAYTRHIELMKPTWVVISSPKCEDSPHGHPHADAVELYRTYVNDPENVRVLGDRPECLLYDICEDGTHVLDSDNGELIEAYRHEDGDGGDGGAKRSAALHFGTQLDSSRPMGRF